MNKTINDAAFVLEKIDERRPAQSGKQRHRVLSFCTPCHPYHIEDGRRHVLEMLDRERLPLSLKHI